MNSMISKMKRTTLSLTSIGRFVARQEWYDGCLTETFSQQRLTELSTIANTSLFNQVYPLQKPDYSKDVTEASSKAFILVHLKSSLGTNIESRLLTDLWRQVARTFGEVKFCEIRADMCIEGYPEKNTPTILVYKDGDIKRQIVTLKELGGERTTIRGKSKRALTKQSRQLTSRRPRSPSCRRGCNQAQRSSSSEIYPSGTRRDLQQY